MPAGRGSTITAYKDLRLFPCLTVDVTLHLHGSFVFSSYLDFGQGRGDDQRKTFLESIESGSNRCSRTRDTRDPCQNMVPEIPTIPLDHQHVSQRFRCVMHRG